MKLEEYEKLIDDVFAILTDAPELNPSNYDHDQVCQLNSKMVEAWSAISYFKECHKERNSQVSDPMKDILNNFSENTKSTH